MITQIIVFLLILYFVKTIYTEFVSNGNPFSSKNSPIESIVEGKFTPKTLQKYNGKDHPKIFIAVKNRVFDVSQGSAFYGPGGPYENFAGRDASRGLALNSFDPSVLTPINEPIDDLKDLKDLEKESLEQWEEHFENRYKVVGTLHENGAVKDEN
ncbi:DAP1 [Candida pseudojiufengensis]|uniref:DAP1 n=1 Tax=Candida pseudojiufengensis TaxID=497109 RepID=UPI0022242097|nr:DAP1 [Candida pseudojiufengensis]KAI5962429.1 DAP1 [Candida pseudojiufengensis]